MILSKEEMEIVVQSVQQKFLNYLHVHYKLISALSNLLFQQYIVQMLVSQTAAAFSSWVLAIYICP